MTTETDPEKVRAFQQEEFERQLRGEYEAAQQRVGEVVRTQRLRWHSTDAS